MEKQLLASGESRDIRWWSKFKADNPLTPESQLRVIKTIKTKLSPYLRKNNRDLLVILTVNFKDLKAKDLFKLKLKVSQAVDLIEEKIQNFKKEKVDHQFNLYHLMELGILKVFIKTPITKDDAENLNVLLPYKEQFYILTYLHESYKCLELDIDQIITQLGAGENSSLRTQQANVKTSVKQFGSPYSSIFIGKGFGYEVQRHLIKRYNLNDQQSSEIMERAAGFLKISNSYSTHSLLNRELNFRYHTLIYLGAVVYNIWVVIVKLCDTQNNLPIIFNLLCIMIAFYMAIEFDYMAPLRTRKKFLSTSIALVEKETNLTPNFQQSIENINLK